MREKNLKKNTYTHIYIHTYVFRSYIEFIDILFSECIYINKCIHIYTYMYIYM